ncbi:MAG TPA: hypothetical protein VJN94_10815, partial [Candidatus Binataceae bacterium]|nr:hypothetical protein [Candidatus Binataceae bacterium]
TLASHGMLNANQEWIPFVSYVRTGWGAPHSGVSFPLLGVAMLALLLTTLPFTLRAGDLPLLGVALVLGVTPFLSVRNLALAVIATAAPLAHHLELLCARYRRYRSIETEPADEMRLRPRSSVILLVLALTITLVSGAFADRLNDGDRYPSGAIRFIDQHRLHGNILNDFNWGEYLIYHEAPRCKVFIDGRYQIVYSPDILSDYLRFAAGGGQALAVVSNYPHDFVLIQPIGPAYRTLATAPGWKLIYCDSVAALFVRRDSDAATIAPVIVRDPGYPGYFP